MSGLFAIALDKATLCFSPPDNSFGLLYNLFDKPKLLNKFFATISALLNFSPFNICGIITFSIAEKSFNK